MADTKILRFGFAAIEHKHIEDLVTMMTEYEIEKYIMALEKVSNGTHKETKGEHIHFVLFVNLKVFNTFKETLKKKYNLSGKNGTTGRYAGWMNINKVRDSDKFIAYTVKDNNLKWKGFEPDEIKKALTASHKKKETIQEELIAHLLVQKSELNKERYEKGNSGCNYDLENLEREIMAFHMNKKVKIGKSQVKNLALTYLQLHMETRFTKEGMDRIYNYMMHN